MSEEQTSAVVLAQPVAQDIQLTATEPDEIKQAQVSLIDWCKQKIISLNGDYAEMKGAYENAVAHKWAASPIKRQVTKLEKRIEFYQKMRSALEHGYVIIPNFPVTVFAIRTKKENPARVYISAGQNWGNRHQQETETLTQGEGEYKNPFPVVEKECTKSAEANKPAEYMDWAEEWKDLEFPIQMARANIMEATNRAMALKIFDDFGVLPQKKKEDPIIVARLLDPRSPSWSKKFVTFMVAWHLDTRDL